MKPCVILFLILGQITESVTVIQIQPIKSAFLFQLLPSGLHTVLSWFISRPLERLNLCPSVTIFFDTLYNPVIGIICSEIFQSYRLIVSLWNDRPVFSAWTQVIGISHFLESKLKFFQGLAVVDSIINGFFCKRVACRHTCLFFHRQIIRLLTAVRIRVIVKSVLLTNPVCNFSEFEPRFFLSPQMFAIDKRNRVDDKMAVQVLCIQMGCHNNLKFFTPHFICKFHPDFLCHLRRYICFLETQISVVGLDTICLLVLFLNRYELVTGNRHITVDTLNIKFSLCFFFVLCISNNICKSLILFRRKLPFDICRSLFGIGRIVNDLTEPFCYRPQLCYCHFISL